MACGGWTRVGASWRKGKATWIKVGSTWRKAKKIWINVNGVWRGCAMGSPIPVSVVWGSLAHAFLQGNKVTITFDGPVTLRNANAFYAKIKYTTRTQPAGGTFAREFVRVDVIKMGNVRVISGNRITATVNVGSSSSITDNALEMRTGAISVGGNVLAATWREPHYAQIR